ncbi:MAG: tetratricopeptide repeat protein [Chitinophagaceae bacterium]|nr:tetratricopeptide repeat protein [Chitinophagaceae bacterium]
MNLSLRTSTVIICCLLTMVAFTQTNRIDSLKMLVQKAGTPKQKLAMLFSLCEERQSLHTDSLLKYARQAWSVANALHNNTYMLTANFYANVAYLKTGLQKQVIINCDNDLNALGNSKENEKLRLQIMQLKGMALIRNEQFKEAIDENLRLLTKAEVLQDTLQQIKAMNSIGWTYMEMGQNQNAINWFYKALNTPANEVIFYTYPLVYNNIASSYNNIQQYDSALYFINKSIDVNKYDLTTLANSQNIKADIFLNLHQPGKAQPLLEAALALRKRIGDPYYLVSDLYQLSVFYAHNQQANKGIATALQGIDMARTYNLTSKIPLLYSGLAESYKMSGDTKGYAQVLENIIQLKDTLFQKNSAEALAGLQASYDMQKKENIIIKQKLDILRKDYFITGSVLVFTVAAILGILFYSSYQSRQKLKLKNLIESQKEKEEKAIKEAEEHQRKHIAAELHDNLGAQISYISSNIDWIIDAPTPLSEADQKNRLKSVHITSQGLMRTLRETIWALTRDRITLEEFSDKLKAYIQTFLQFQPNTHFQSHENITDQIVFKPIQALNIFRIFQEGVNNALKYSKASNLLLNIEAHNQHFNIKLTDNGIGFASEAIGADHYGLAIMQNRAAEAGFSCTVTTALNQGTAICVSGNTTSELIQMNY